MPNLVKSCLAWLLLLSLPLYAAEQVVTPDPPAQQAGQNAAVSLGVDYSTANPEDETLSGLGLRMHWDSSRLTYDGLSSTFAPGLQPIGAPMADAGDLDGDADTDRYLLVAWLDGGGNWPGAGTTPLRLFTANFTTSAGFNGSTTINFSASSTAAGYDLAANPATIQEQPANIPVPDVTGTSQAAAQASITGAGLVVGNVTQQASDTVPAGSVIAQDPPAGTSVAPGSTVDLVVSSGPAAGGGGIPNVVGLGLPEAAAAIVDAGFVLGSVAQVVGNGADPGTVIGQDPAAGANLAAGAAINLVVAADSTSIPTLTAWGMLLFSLALGLAGIRYARGSR